MRLRSTTMTVMVLATAMAMAGCADDTSTEPDDVTTTSAAARATTSEPEAADAELQALQELLAAQGLDESLATFGVEWCTHQDLAMLSREVGNMELAEQVAAAASEAAC